jgi:hypothetical protein
MTTPHLCPACREPLTVRPNGANLDMFCSSEDCDSDACRSGVCCPNGTRRETMLTLLTEKFRKELAADIAPQTPQEREEEIEHERADNAHEEGICRRMGI